MIEPIKKLPYKPNAPWAQCPMCRMVFTVPANFTRHLTGTPDNRTCTNPSEAGLVLNESDTILRGMWQMPNDGRNQNRLKSLKARAQKPRSTQKTGQGIGRAEIGASRSNGEGN